MNTHSLLFRRLRVILDCILITLLILIASAKSLHVQAGPDLQPSLRAASLAEARPFSDNGLAVLDNNTLAAMIAAENAALTPPIYFIDMPAISR